MTTFTDPFSGTDPKSMSASATVLSSQLVSQLSQASNGQVEDQEFNPRTQFNPRTESFNPRTDEPSEDAKFKKPARPPLKPVRIMLPFAVAVVDGTFKNLKMTG